MGEGRWIVGADRTASASWRGFPAWQRGGYLAGGYGRERDSDCGTRLAGARAGPDLTRTLEHESIRTLAGSLLVLSVR